jgi:hypothetical protein
VKGYGDKFAVAHSSRLVVIGADMARELEGDWETGKNEQGADRQSFERNEDACERKNAGGCQSKQLGTFGGAQTNDGRSLPGCQVIIDLVKVRAKQN